MPRRKRAVREALLGPMFALTVFSYQQAVKGNLYVAGAGAVGVAATFAAYRWADAEVIEAATEAGDVEDLKPALRRVGRWLRNRAKR